MLQRAQKKGDRQVRITFLEGLVLLGFFGLILSSALFRSPSTKAGTTQLSHKMTDQQTPEKH